MTATFDSSLKSQKLGMAFLILYVRGFNFSSSARQRATIMVGNNIMVTVGVHYSRTLTQFFFTNSHWWMSGCPCPTDENPDAQGTHHFIEDQSTESQVQELNQYNIPHCSIAVGCLIRLCSHQVLKGLMLLKSHRVHTPQSGSKGPSYSTPLNLHISSKHPCILGSLYLAPLLQLW